MNKMKKGDEVIVIAGKDKGKRGTVQEIIDGGNKLLISGINMVKKHVKPNPNAGIEGGIVDLAKPIHHSNVQCFDSTKKKGSRVGIRTLKDGQRVRFYKASDQLVDIQS